MGSLKTFSSKTFYQKTISNQDVKFLPAHEVKKRIPILRYKYMGSCRVELYSPLSNSLRKKFRNNLNFKLFI